MAAGVLQPLRLNIKSAGERLDLTPDGVRKLIQGGVFEPFTPNGRGRGKRMYLDPGEVEAYARGGLAGVVAYREKLNRKRK